MSRSSCLNFFVVAGVITIAASSAPAQITIPTVTIGNAENAPDPFTGNLYGSVAYIYNIGTTEVTNAQYAAFLNAVAATDPYSLYNTKMANSFGGIARSGSPGSYTYATVSGRANSPVNYVSFWDAARFANWLHNGQGNGDTETGAYTLTAGGISANTVTRNADWRWAVTSENEWYKAAFYQPASAGGDHDNYWLYPTSSNSAPTVTQANFDDPFGKPIAVGSYAANHSGTFDMGGNVWEWNDAIINGSLRGIRGGAFNDSASSQAADPRWATVATNEFPVYGFRVSQSAAPTCHADFNADGFLTFEDFDAFVSAFEGGSATADFNADGFLTFEDFDAFVTAFEAGC